jgi:hypothetical protein
MTRIATILLGGFGLLLTACSSSIPPASASSSAHTLPDLSTSKADSLLRQQKQKLEDIQQAYQDCKDVGDYARMLKLARARRAELEGVIRSVHQWRLTREEHERILGPLRQERDWHLQVIEVASAM